MWVGVTAQRLGIVGGRIRWSTRRRSSTPIRCGTASLAHPGDQFSYDIYSQAGQGGARDAPTVLGGLRPKRLIAVGESQSAFYLTSYVNGLARETARVRRLPDPQPRRRRGAVRRQLAELRRRRLGPHPSRSRRTRARAHHRDRSRAPPLRRRPAARLDDLPRLGDRGLVPLRHVLPGVRSPGRRHERQRRVALRHDDHRGHLALPRGRRLRQADQRRRADLRGARRGRGDATAGSRAARRRPGRRAARPMDSPTSFALDAERQRARRDPHAAGRRADRDAVGPRAERDQLLLPLRHHDPVRRRQAGGALPVARGVREGVERSDRPGGEGGLRPCRPTPQNIKDAAAQSTIGGCG